jgi:sporulation protein YqfC
VAKKLKIEGKKKKSKWKLLNFKETELETEIIGSAHIEIFGNSKISIDGCLGVYEYRDTYLKLKLLKGSIILCGSEFNIIYFENRLISIKGKISSIEFV